VLDFDGSLSEIVEHPDLAVPVDGAHDALSQLTRRYRVVAILTGRRSEEVARRLDVPHVQFVGLYGMEDEAPELVTAIAPSVETAAAAVPQAWVEDKGVSIAVHYRQAPDPESARRTLALALQPIATEGALDVVEGKMVIELVPHGRPMKGAAVERLAGQHELEAILFAGDDRADLDAFGALDRLDARGAMTMRVAVRGAETPPELVDAADVVVDGPRGLVGLLRQLA
jgi:trehalose 6-phosphate phosphatase